VAIAFVSRLCYVLKYDCRFLIMHVNLVLEGCLASQCGMAWATCMWGIGVFATLFPLIPMWALISPDGFVVS
jgi:hypothetical protein